MKHSIQYGYQGTDDRFEYLSQSFLEIVNQILVTQETIADIISGLGCTWGDVTGKDGSRIVSEVNKSKELIKELRDFTGYKEP